MSRHSEMNRALLLYSFQNPAFCPEMAAAAMRAAVPDYTVADMVRVVDARLEVMTRERRQFLQVLQFLRGEWQGRIARGRLDSVVLGVLLDELESFIAQRLMESDQVRVSEVVERFMATHCADPAIVRHLAARWLALVVEGAMERMTIAEEGRQQKEVIKPC